MAVYSGGESNSEERTIGSENISNLAAYVNTMRAIFDALFHYI
jgi:hypothetical protein